MRSARERGCMEKRSDVAIDQRRSVRPPYPMFIPDEPDDAKWLRSLAADLGYGAPK